MLANSGADIRHGGGKAFYSPAGDYVQMPPRECFVDEPAYYATALHELAHWTGAKHRLNRLTDKQPFGSPEYAKEEIRADLSSLFLAAELGIPYDPKDQAAAVLRLVQDQVRYLALTMNDGGVVPAQADQTWLSWRGRISLANRNRYSRISSSPSTPFARTR